MMEEFRAVAGFLREREANTLRDALLLICLILALFFAWLSKILNGGDDD